MTFKKNLYSAGRNKNIFVNLTQIVELKFKSYYLKKGRFNQNRRKNFQNQQNIIFYLWDYNNILNTNFSDLIF